MEVTDEKCLSADGRSLVRREKQVSGSEIVDILKQHRISAGGRNPESSAIVSSTYIGRNKLGHVPSPVSQLLPEWAI
jgi:hypothetical protein